MNENVSISISRKIRGKNTSYLKIEYNIAFYHTSRY